MSTVADIILVTGTYDTNCKNSLDEYLKKHHNGEHLVKVDDYAGGHKAIQADVYMAAINGLDINDFLDCFYNTNFEDPNLCQLMIKNENDNRFEIYIPEDRKFY